MSEVNRKKCFKELIKKDKYAPTFLSVTVALKILKDVVEGRAPKTELIKAKEMISQASLITSYNYQKASNQNVSAKLAAKNELFMINLRNLLKQDFYYETLLF
jgi:hypothetical protein